MKNHLCPEIYTFLPTLLQGLTQGLRKTDKNRALFRSRALPGLNEKPSFSRDVYNAADFAPGPYQGFMKKPSLSRDVYISADFAAKRSADVEMRT